jgi:glycine oxidase
MNDCCIVGGGIIGLSLARELAGRGVGVRVLARGRGTDTTSWAAAGILPPAPLFPGCSPADALTAWSDRLHREWSAELVAETGVDNGLIPSGGLHLARGTDDEARLRDELARWRGRGAEAVLLDRAGLFDLEPALGAGRDAAALVGALHLPGEMQIRPSRHLDALEASCRRRGVVVEEAEVREFVVRDRRVERAVTGSGSVSAETWILAAGAWTGGLLGHFGVSLDTRPIRGQIALLRLGRPVLRRIVNRGLDYLVPRPDGRLLVGSTIEDVGFDPRVEPATVARLRAVADELLGAAAREAPLERSWAGLRPGSPDGAPTIGRLPAHDNVFVSAGHFRAGLHQSTGSAVLLADLVTGRHPSIDPAPFAPGRPAPPAGTVPPGSTADYLAREAAADTRRRGAG